MHNFQRSEGIELGLESFWIATIVSYGLLLSLIFFTSLALFCREVARAAGAGAWQVWLFFFIVASTSVSISAKTHTFGLIIAMMLVLLPKRARAQ